MRQTAVLVAFLFFGLCACMAVNPNPTPAETWIQNELDYGVLPEYSHSQMTELIFTKRGPSGLFQFRIGDGDRRVSSAAMMVNDVRVIALSSPGYFDRTGSSDELLTSFLRWTSFEEPSDIAPLVSDLSKKIVVCTAELKTLYEELGATNVVHVNFLEGDAVVYAPLDTDVLVMHFAVANVWNNSQLNRLYETAQEYLDRNTGGLIVGGESSFYKWIWYGNCSDYPGNKLLNTFGVHFACRWWGARSAASILTMNYRLQSVYESMAYVNDLTMAGVVDNADFDVGTIMPPAAFGETMITLARGCAACDLGQDSNAPIEVLINEVVDQMTSIVDSGNCEVNLPLTGATRSSYACIDIAHARNGLVPEAEIRAEPTSEIFPGLNVPMGPADLETINLNIDTDRCLLQSTGGFALAGVPVTVTVPQEWVNFARMAVGIWKPDVHHKSPVNRNPNSLYQEFPITTAVFTFVSGTGGPVYLLLPCDPFIEDFDSRVVGAIEIVGVVPSVHYRLGETTEQQWDDMLVNLIGPWAEIETNDSVYTVPKTDVVNHSFEDITTVAQYWQDIIDLYAAFRDQPPDLFKERGVIDVTVAFGYLFASYPMVGPPNTGAELVRVNANVEESWGWLHEHGHRFERGNSYGPDKGNFWIMFPGTVEVVTNIFTCVGIVNTDAVNSRCDGKNGGVNQIVNNDRQWSGGETNLGAFDKLDFFLAVINSYGYDAFTRVISRGRLSRFPVDNQERINRLWLLLSEEMQRNTQPQFDAYGLAVDHQLIYEQQMIVEQANVFVRMADPVVDLSESDNSVSTFGTLALAQESVDRLFESSVSAQFTGPSGRVEINVAESDVNTAFSISMWVKIDASSTGAVLVSAYDPNEEDGETDWSLMINDVGGLTYTWPSGSALSEGTLPLNAWVHVGLTTDGSSVSFFINGELAGNSEAGPIADTTGYLVINADTLLIGSVAEFAQFNKAVDEARMHALYAPSPFNFPQFIDPGFMPEADPNCPDYITPESISACNSRDGIDGNPSDCDLCMAFLCSGGDEPEGVDCRTVCPAGTIVNDLGACDACDVSCGTCSEAGSAEACLTCAAEGNFPYLQETSCVPECDSDRVLVNDVCELCDSSCATCEGVSASECLTCDGTLFEFGSCVDQCTGGNVEHEGSCLTACPSTHFNDGGLCVKCDSHCETCEGSASQCLTCDEAGGFPFQSGTACLSACPEKEFAIEGTFECLACADNCQLCEGAEDMCTSCDETGETPFFFQFNCLSECPAYTVQDGFVCEGCDVTSETPFDNEGECVSECDFASFQFSCVSACPAGHFKDQNDVCTPCDGNCLACEESATQCTDCDTAGLVPFLMGSTCVSECPTRTFADAADTCRGCADSCAECTADGELACSECDTESEVPLFIELPNGGQCVSKCPENFFEEAQECFECHESCGSCTSADASACLTCADTEEVLLEGACVSSCPSDMFVSDSGAFPTCVACAGDCLTCEDSATTCTSCFDQDDLTVLVNGQCLPCASTCLTCAGDVNTCTSCDLDGDFPVLEVGECIEECQLFTLGEECVAACPSDHFANGENVCEECSEACEACEGSATACTVCNDSGPTPFWDNESETCVASCGSLGKFSFEGSCVSACPSDRFANEADSSCQLCADECARCEGAADVCIGCHLEAPRNILHENECLEECPSALYEVNGTCEECHESCAECTAADAASCTACFVNFHLENGECVADVTGPTCTETLGNMQAVDSETQWPEQESVLASREALCWPGTSVEADNCVPFGSEITGAVEVVVDMVAELRCSICTDSIVEETFSMEVRQAVVVPVETKRELLFLSSLISNDVVSENLDVLAAAAAEDGGIAASVAADARAFFLDNLEINDLCALRVVEVQLEEATVSTAASFSMPALGGSAMDDVCELPSDAQWANDEAYVPRCICDDSVANMEDPCAQLDFAPFNGEAGAICQARECSEPTTEESEWVWLEVVLDTDFFRFGDEEAEAVMSELVNYLQLEFGLSFENLFLISLEPGSVEMTLVLDSSASLNSDVNTAEDMVADLMAGTLVLSAPVTRAVVLTQGTGGMSTEESSGFFTTDLSTAFVTTDLSTFFTTDLSTAVETTDFSTFVTTDLSTAFVTTDLSTAVQTTDLSTAVQSTDESTDESTEESTEDVFVFSSVTDERTTLSFSNSPDSSSRRTVSGAYESTPAGLSFSGDRSRSEKYSSSASSLAPGLLAMVAVAVLLL